MVTNLPATVQLQTGTGNIPDIPPNCQCALKTGRLTPNRNGNVKWTAVVGEGFEARYDELENQAIVSLGVTTEKKCRLRFDYTGDAFTPVKPRSVV